jgi:hypothetical protein
MRCLMKVSIPVETGNHAAREGTLGSTIESICSEMKPEATYFMDDSGKRTAFLFFDLKDSSQIPEMTEPWFLAFNAHVEIHPCMNAEDLKKAGPGIERVVKKHHSMMKKAA